MCQQNRITQAAVVENVRVQVVSRSPNLEKAQNGNPGGRKLTMLDIPDVEGIQMPKPNELLSAKQRDGTELRAKQIYEDTWNWLNSIGCAGYVSPQTIERYAMCVARWLQCEEMTKGLGFLSKHPTTGKPVTSPFINIGINYMNQASRQWDNIMQIVKRKLFRGLLRYQSE